MIRARVYCPHCSLLTCLIVCWSLVPGWQNLRMTSKNYFCWPHDQQKIKRVSLQCIEYQQILHTHTYTHTHTHTYIYIYIYIGLLDFITVLVRMSNNSKYSALSISRGSFSKTHKTPHTLPVRARCAVTFVGLTLALSWVSWDTQESAKKNPSLLSRWMYTNVSLFFLCSQPLVLKIIIRTYPDLAARLEACFCSQPSLVSTCGFVNARSVKKDVNPVLAEVENKAVYPFLSVVLLFGRVKN